jgi:hypothetical protein
MGYLYLPKLKSGGRSSVWWTKDLGVDGRSTPGRPAGEPGPMLTEAAALPSRDGVGRHDHQSLSPPGPDSGQPNPEQAISLA